MNTRRAATEVCPVCTLSSVYTNGRAPCSLSCAIAFTKATHESWGLSLDRALELVSREFQAWGLPDDPAPNDLFRYRYVEIKESFTSRYWKIDRALLVSAGLNVEYAWVGTGRGRRRIYRFTAQALLKLPEVMADYKVRSFSDEDMNYLKSKWEPYWHFLAALEPTEF